MLDLALDSRVFLDNELDCAIQELDLLFNTENTELINDVSYGIELEQFLWSLTPVSDALEEYLRDVISKHTYYVNRLNFTLSVDFLQGDYRSIYYVKIGLTDPNTQEKRSRIYRLQ